jgi:RNA polymerase sigma-70 factor (ECF subfamily)
LQLADVFAMSLSPSPRADGNTSTSWLNRVRQRDPQAWRRLTELYGPLVYHWGRRQGLSAEDASDVMQEVFTAVAGAVDHFLHSPERGTFRGWLWTIARNKLRDHFRRTSGREQADGGSEAFQRLASIPELWSDDSHDATDPRELQRLLWRALDRVRGEFEERTWQAFWLSTVEWQPTDEIAQRLGLSVNSVRQAKSRVLRRLRRELGD